MSLTALIGIDWGTSNVRGFRYAANGEVIETRWLDAGLKQVAAGAWAAAFETHFGDWLRDAPGVPALLCGMVGSRQGWSEAAYVECPATCDLLADRLHPISGTSLRIVPGLCTVDAEGVPDVMRGEETQLAGLDIREPSAVCLPGTHSKWVSFDGQRIETFRTMMTGELFEILSRDSLLAQMSEPGEAEADAFARGLDRADGRCGLLHELFGVRTLRLFDKLAATSVADYLSGLLIGHELASMADMVPTDVPVTVIGSRALASRYVAALEHLDRTVQVVDGETAAARGLWRIASQAGLVMSS